jgi:hypothetical protein
MNAERGIKAAVDWAKAQPTIEAVAVVASPHGGLLQR